MGRIRGLVSLGVALVSVATAVRGYATTAADICPATADPCIVSEGFDVTDGSSLDFGTRELRVVAGGGLDVGAGAMTIHARLVTIESQGELQASGPGPAGHITATADAIAIAGAVRADGSDGGNILLTADTLVTGGTISVNGNSRTGFGGEIGLTGRQLTIGGDVFALGLQDSIGGCVTVSADANVDLVGTISVSSGEGGDIAVVAGVVGGGNLRVDPNAVLNASGTGAGGGSGGVIELTARGDGNLTGHVQIDGSIQSNGAGAGQGGDGGCITVTAAGDVTVTNPDRSLDVNGGAPDGFAGEISLAAGRKIEIDTEVNAKGSGSEGAGGDIGVQAGTDLAVAENARISVTGPDDGGTIDLIARGEVLIMTDRVDASGLFDGGGGDIRIRATGPDGSVLIDGTVLANGGGSPATPGRGGDIEVTAADAFLLTGPPDEGGVIRAEGGFGGGKIMLRTIRGAMRLNGAVLASGAGSALLGGTISAVSGAELEVNGEIDVTNNLKGGRIALEAAGPIAVTGTLTASGLDAMKGSGGTIDAMGAGTISITGQLTASGGLSMLQPAGLIGVRGCDVTVDLDGILTVAGSMGVNRIVSRRLLVINGEVTADPLTGRNDLVYRDAANPPVIFAGATVIPRQRLIFDPTLQPCAVCGNSQTEPPETCDDGNQEDGDGCSSMCQIEAEPCDVDGDSDVDATDLVALQIELFDGDGDRAIDVGGGEFPGTIGTDANQDARVTVADAVHCIEVLAEQ